MGERSWPTPFTFVIAAPKVLDCAAFAALFHRPPTHLVEASSHDLDQAVQACLAKPVDVFLLIDGFVRARALTAARGLLERQAVRVVGYLGEECVIARAEEVLRIRNMCYLTRSQSPKEVDDVLRCAYRIARSNGPSSERSPRIRFRQNAQAIAKFDAFGILRLSPRERQVMQSIASGLSVRETAVVVGLAESTVDNHKCRLMKKLNIHNAKDLVRIALKSGLID